MNFVVYPAYKKKTNSENKILVQPLGNGPNKTASIRRVQSSSTIPDPIKFHSRRREDKEKFCRKIVTK